MLNNWLLISCNQMTMPHFEEAAVCQTRLPLQPADIQNIHLFQAPVIDFIFFLKLIKGKLLPNDNLWFKDFITANICLLFSRKLITGKQQHPAPM